MDYTFHVRMSRNLFSLCFIMFFFLTGVRAQEQVRPLHDTLSPSRIVAAKERETSVHLVKLQQYPFVYPAGEPDVVKYVQTLPGVATGIEGTAAFYARGGNYGNNQIVLDGTTLYGASHLLGLTTVVPAGVVEENRFQIGGFSGEDANFTASIVKLQTKDGDMENTKGSISVSTTMVGGELSMPIVKGKASLLVAGRFAPLGWEYGMFRPLLSSDLQAPDTLKTIVADAFAKVSMKTAKGGQFHISGFFSMDAYRFSLAKGSDDLIRWRNLVGNADYKHPLGDKTTLKTHVSFNNFNSLQAMIRKSENTTTLQMLSVLTEGLATLSIRHEKEPGWMLQGGFDVRVTHFNPGAYKQTKRENGSVEINHSRYAQIYGLYAETEYLRIPWLKVRASVRGNLFHARGYTIFNPEFRTLLQFRVIGGLSLQLTFDEMVQYYHTLEGLPTGWSLDLKVPSSKRYSPEKSTQMYGGLSWEKNGYHLVAGFYGKQMRNLIYFSNAADFFGSAISSWEDRIALGSGRSYGMELEAGVQRGRFDAMLAYTLSKTDRTFPDLNESRPFPAKFDRRHILSFKGNVETGRTEKIRHGLNTLVSFYSGHMESLQSSVYPAFMPGMEPTDEWYGRFSWRNYYSHPNNYRMPYYFRWDAGFYIYLQGRLVNHMLNIGVYNLTNRHNAASLYYNEADGKWKKLSIFPLMPSLNYVITF